MSPGVPTGTPDDIYTFWHIIQRVIIVDEAQENEATTELEFMRKSRFVKIKDKFSKINPKAEKTIKDAKDTDILSLTLSFNSSIKVVKADLFDESKFIDLAF